MAALAITSLTFMLVWVPEPVCHTSSGKCPSSLAVGDVLRGCDDGAGALAVERAEIAVDLGGGALDQAERAHDLDRHALGADAEIVQRALGLRAPELVGGNIERAEGVGFDAGLAGALLCAWLWPA